MKNPILLPCDGCGQLAGPEHITRRLQRLEWATRFRPLHIQAVLLGASAPQNDNEYLYWAEGAVSGEGGTILEAAQVDTAGKSREAALSEFQKLGLLLTHVLECPLEGGVSATESVALMQKHLPAAVARIRRSLKPKRVVLISPELDAVAEELQRSNLGCPVASAWLSPSSSGGEVVAFRAALGLA